MRNRRTALPCVGLVLATLLTYGAGADVLQTLRKGHPRLFVLNEDLPRVKQLIAADPLARQWHDSLVAQAQKVLTEPPVEHVLIGPRLLDKSRTALRRISLLGGLYRLDGDARYAARAKEEMLAVCAFADWNPKHFLDTAEMTNAVATGYDWLYDTLSPDERTTIRKGIVELGLKPSLAIYKGHRWWAVANHNWNQVCNGGMTVGALAIADEEPELARTIVDGARESIPLAMASYGPDGGWAEGPGYWDYATRYNVYYLAAVETALGTDFGLKKTPGFADAGYFHIQSIGPVDLTFNYADAGAGAGKCFAMFWLARAFDRPMYAAHERAIGGNRGVDILDLLWFRPAGPAEVQAKPGASALFRGVDVAFFRSAWDNPKAVFVGFKGGDNKANHAHLDLGTFVLDAFGARWAEDLGGDYYNLPGYFGSQRWSYYRLRTEGHNTLVVNGENQDVDAKATIVAYGTSDKRSFAVADLSGAYKKPLRSWRRGIELLDGQRVLVQDEVEGKAAVNIVWNFHTHGSAAIAGDGASATITAPEGRKKASREKQSAGGKGEAGEPDVVKVKGATIKARILSPAGATFELISADPPAPQNPNPGGMNLTVKLPADMQKVSIVVLFSAVDDNALVKSEPLAAWIDAGRLK